jgi:hypothetical protein
MKTAWGDEVAPELLRNMVQGYRWSQLSFAALKRTKPRDATSRE